MASGNSFTVWLPVTHSSVASGFSRKDAGSLRMLYFSGTNAIALFGFIGITSWFAPAS